MNFHTLVSFILAYPIALLVAGYFWLTRDTPSLGPVLAPLTGLGALSVTNFAVRIGVAEPNAWFDVIDAVGAGALVGAIVFGLLRLRHIND